MCLSIKGGIASAFVLALAAVATPAQAVEVKFMTGPQGGFWVPLGGALKDLSLIHI